MNLGRNRVTADGHAGLVGILGVLLAGLSGSISAVQSSTLAPFLPAGVAAALLMVVISLERPSLAVWCALLLMYFPRGVLPAGWYAALFDAALALAMLGFIFAILFRRRRMAWCVTTALMTLFLVWCLITVMWSTDLIEARRQFVAYAIGTLFLFLLHNLVDSIEKLDALMKSLAVGAGTLIMAGLITVASGNYEFGSRLQIADVNQNFVPTLLVVGLAGVIWTIARAQSVSHPLGVATILIYVMCTLGLTGLSGSRGGLLSVGIAFSLMLIPSATRKWAAQGLGVAVLLVFIASPLFVPTIERFSQGEGGQLGSRSILWQSGFMLIADYPVGAGLGNGKQIIPDYLYTLASDDELGRFALRSTHNPVLDVGIDTGVPGMILYAGAILAAFISFVRMYLVAGNRRSKDTGELPILYYGIMFGVTLGYLVSWIRDGAGNHHPLIFVVLALLIVPARLRETASVSRVRKIEGEHGH